MYWNNQDKNSFTVYEILWTISVIFAFRGLGPGAFHIRKIRHILAKIGKIENVQQSPFKVILAISSDKTLFFWFIFWLLTSLISTSAIIWEIGYFNY